MLRRERLQLGAASRYKCAEFAGDKADAELQIQGVWARDFCLDALLLVPHNDGIEFLRTFHNLPSDIVPATLKKSAKPLGRPMGGPPGGPLRFDGERPRFGDRDGYRGGPRGGPPGEFAGDKGGAPVDYQPSFRGPAGRGGFGRGSGGYGAGATTSDLP